MDSDRDLAEQIDLMGISVERNLAVTVLLVNIILIIQGITILLFVLLIDRVVLSVVVGVLGAAIVLLGLYALFGNLPKIQNIVRNANRLQEELPDPQNSHNPNRTIQKSKPINARQTPGLLSRYQPPRRG